MLQKTEVVINSVDINGIVTPAKVYAETYTEGDYTVPAAPYLDGQTFEGWKVNDTLYATADEVLRAVETLVKAKTTVTVAVSYKSLFRIPSRTSCLHLFLAIRQYGGGEFPSSGEKSDGAVRTRRDSKQALRKIPAYSA